ncbi:hypothetical protein [Hydrogenophaga sp.]|uniref:hypothetical protein n=1 Tax=Hydrogenophaga sp. TaxID=1904254 RepID=UPI003F6B296C
MSDRIVHIDAQPDIAKLVDLIKAALDIPASPVDPRESEHVAAANALVQKMRPDAILLNINVPGLDGDEVFARAGSSASLGGIVQLLTRARRKGAGPAPAGRAGCDAYITKDVGKLDSV